MADNLDYGPLQGLIGIWQGESGMDIAPEPDGDDHNPYYETIVFEAAGDVDNADTQELNIVRYHQVVSKKRNDKEFHNESGYITWEPESQDLVLSLVIPRGVALVAHGEFVSSDDEIVFKFQADTNSEWGIVESPFMRDHAHTERFSREIRLVGDQLTYSQTTQVSIYGRLAQHTDTNRLTKTS